jgi:16S rRNA processing protein RimM
LKLKNTVFIVKGFIKIGKLTRLHGIKGAVVLHIPGDHILDTRKTRSLMIEINGVLTPFFVKEIKLSGKNFILSFDSVSTIEAAQRLLNAAVWLDEKSLKKQVVAKDLAGYSLNDKERGNLGPIVEVVEMPGQRLFAITINGNEVLLPFTEELVIKIDHKTKTVFYVSPEGLIDMYLG